MGLTWSASRSGRCSSGNCTVSVSVTATDGVVSLTNMILAASIAGKRLSLLSRLDCPCRSFYNLTMAFRAANGSHASSPIG